MGVVAENFVYFRVIASVEELVGAGRHVSVV